MIVGRVLPDGDPWRRRPPPDELELELELDDPPVGELPRSMVTVEPAAPAFALPLPVLFDEWTAAAVFQASLDVVVFFVSVVVPVFQFPPEVSMVTVLSPLSLSHDWVVYFSEDVSGQLSFEEDHEVAFASGRAAMARSPTSLVRPTIAFKGSRGDCKLKSICTTRMQRRIECDGKLLD